MQDVLEKGTVTSEDYIGSEGEFSTYAGSYNGIVARSGDVLIARDNLSSRKPNAWVGHAGIVVNSGSSVAEFPGVGMKPRQISLKQFFSENGEIFVLRHNDYNASIDAAQWANKFLKNNSSADYKITFSRFGLDPNYCSKFVWQSYYFGAGKQIAPFFPYQPLLPMEMVWFNQGNTQITYVP